MLTSRQILKVVDRADMVIDRYAYIINKPVIQVVHLIPPHNAAAISLTGDVIKHNMSEIEISIMLKHYKDNKWKLLDKLTDDESTLEDALKSMLGVIEGKVDLEKCKKDRLLRQ